MTENITGDVVTDRDGRRWEYAGEPEFPDPRWRLLDHEGDDVVTRTPQGLVDEFGPLTGGPSPQAAKSRL